MLQQQDMWILHACWQGLIDSYKPLTLRMMWYKGRLRFKNTQLYYIHDYWMLQLMFNQLVFLFFLSVCTGAYATFSVISRSTATVVHSITVSYSGPGCTCGVGWLDCVSSDPVLPSGDVLEDRLYLQHKQMITKVGTSKLKLLALLWGSLHRSLVCL
jgi:hypothetical protein